MCSRYREHAWVQAIWVWRCSVPEALGRICRIRGFRDDVYDDVRTHSDSLVSRDCYWAAKSLGVCSRSSSAVHSIALYVMYVSYNRFDSVPVLEWIVIT